MVSVFLCLPDHGGSVPVPGVRPPVNRHIQTVVFHSQLEEVSMKTRTQKFLVVVICAACIAGFALIFPGIAYAADITVTDAGEGTSGDGNCSLREAIDNANNDYI